ncbi:site-specific DNA-methyltransferase [Actinobacillus seminis]|uniref:site-specific DNA-methyltransferase (adenine-specific) n=1 Tax=Actinobacillus seminis TaxID=722 RepID=A0A263HDN7_9PAST|nr:site-specific DNA-methyltransferase [Actinobacillus seminis]OZN25211.1 site-specific DNA-methyltransferase [Actinobacillus seminis]SUU36198.1 adenine specific DNA methylase Mod [Actinobacillus seminis]
MQLKLLLPEIFSEGQIDFDKFKQLFADNISTDPDRYHLNWAGKSQAYQQLQIPTHKTLTPCVEESVNFEQTQNIFIEGENLDVLKALQKSYFNSVKMIYIDPPYNTGNDFVYNDNFAQSQADYQTQTGEIGEDGLLKKAFRKNSKENGHYHSNWLNMMLPRLHLARNLLKDDGVIFISIDDNEQAQLKLLCDEVFGEENFVSSLVWALGTGTQAGHFVRAHETVLVYFKDKKLVPNFSGGEGIIEHSALKKISAKNPASEFSFPKGTRWDAPDDFELTGTWGNSEKTTLIKGRMLCKDKKLVEDVVLSAGWAQKGQMKSYFSGQETIDSKGQKVLSFYFNKSGVLRYEKERRVVNPATLLQGIASTKNGSDEINELFSEKIFDYPKPTKLLKFFVTLATDKNDLILDFFSGSGSIADAIMQLNAENEDSHRCFISVQLPEDLTETIKTVSADGKKTLENAIQFLEKIGKPALISEITKERIRRAGSQILQKNDENRPLDIGFKVFKLTDSHFKQWQSPTEENLAEQLDMFIDNVKDGAEPHAMLYEILLRLGLKLTAKVQWENSVFWIEDEKSQHYAILLERIDEALLAGVIAQQPLKVVALDRLFAGNDALKKNAELQMKDAAVAFFVI